MLERVIDFGKLIPIFPLPQCVLLPHATIPLHIFEPRYRRMVSDVLDSHGLIAMGCFEGDRWRSEYQGHPPIRKVLCVGYVVRHETLPDGLYNILLQGLTRAELIEEPDGETMYRTGRFQMLDNAPIDEDRLAAQRQQIEDLLHDAEVRRLSAVSSIHNWLSDEIPTPALLDLTAMSLCEDSDKRYQVLREPDVHVRAEILIDQLEGLRRTLLLAGRFGSGKTDDGLTLN